MLLSFDTKLLKYAGLAIKLGLNIQKNQHFHISCSNDNLKLIQIITKKSHKNDIKQFIIDSSDNILFSHSL
ncbi:aminopeptidase [Lysinibacillus sp. RC79]|uniref:aminopeptidase n=1 Tax=Lysinibacillus sp. RC79 TaxID=3156296 RepID=UPI003516AB71